MLKEKKRGLIDKLAGDLSQSELVIATNYRGLTAKQMSELRHNLTKGGNQYHVVKNTLARIAAKKAGKERMIDIIDGPVALAFGCGNIVSLSKLLITILRAQNRLLRSREDY